MAEQPISKEDVETFLANLDNLSPEDRAALDELGREVKAKAREVS